MFVKMSSIETHAEHKIQLVGKGHRSEVFSALTFTDCQENAKVGGCKTSSHNPVTIRIYIYS